MKKRIYKKLIKRKFHTHYGDHSFHAGIHYWVDKTPYYERRICKRTSMYSFLQVKYTLLHYIWHLRNEIDNSGLVDTLKWCIYQSPQNLLSNLQKIKYRIPAAAQLEDWYSAVIWELENIDEKY